MKMFDVNHDHYSDGNPHSVCHAQEVRKPPSLGGDLVAQSILDDRKDSLFHKIKEKKSSKVTALLLVNMQNEFTHFGGKLHDKVKDVMDKTGMMKNLPPLVKKARACGVKVLYANVIMKTGKFKKDKSVIENHSFGQLDGVFQEGSWNARIDRKVQPQEND